MRILYARDSKGIGDTDRVKRDDFVDVCEYPSGDRDEIFRYMQGEFMTRERLRRVRGLVRSGGTDHVSMGAGDLAIEGCGRVWRRGLSGWREVTFS